MDSEWMRRAQDEANSVGACVAGSAVFGGSAGALIAMLKGTPVKMYSISMAANFMLATTVFSTANAAIMLARGGENDMAGWAASGGLTGGLLTYGFVPQKTVRGALAFGVAGAVGKFGADQLSDLREQLRTERLNELERERKGEASPQPYAGANMPVMGATQDERR